MTLQQKPAVNPLPWLVLTTLLWGGSFVFNKIGFRDIPPVAFLFFRFTLATLVMGVLCRRRLHRLDPVILRKGGAVGLALAAANLTFVMGVDGTTVSRAGFLNNLFVLLVPLLSLALWKVKPSPALFAGLILAAAGLFPLAWGGTEGFSTGDLFSTVCSVFIALHIILVSRLLHDEDVWLVTLVQFATVAAAGGLLTLFLRPPLVLPGAESLGALVYCAIFPTVICFTIQNTFQRYTTPTEAGLVYTLDPVWSMLGGMLFLGERLNALEWTGCMLILAGVLIPLLPLSRRNAERLLPEADDPVAS